MVTFLQLDSSYISRDTCIPLPLNRCYVITCIELYGEGFINSLAPVVQTIFGVQVTPDVYRNRKYAVLNRISLQVNNAYLDV